VTDFFILLTVVEETFIIFVIVVRQEPSTRLATPLTFAHWILVRCAPLVFCETRAVSEMPVTFGAGISNMGERARGAVHAVTTCLFADFVTLLVHNLLHALQNYFLAVAAVRLVFRHHRTVD